MQFFPVDSIIDSASSLTAGSSQGSSGNGFDSVLSSFIEEDRYDYSGRPSGFSAFGPESGTLDSEDARRIAEQLRKRNVPEISVGQLEALAASGAPLTIGTIYNTLSGKGRLTDDLSDAENASFKIVLDKLGFSKEEQETMLGLSADGDTKGMWSLMSKKLQSMEATADLNKQELSALLRGMDASSNTRKNLLALFGDNDMQEFSGEGLEKLLSGLQGEYARREQAAALARNEARSAIVASFEKGRAEGLSAPVDDTRGSRRADHQEALMQNSVRKNTGVDQLKTDVDLNGEEQAFGDNEGRSRSERIMATQEDFAAVRKAARGESDTPKAENTVDKLLKNVAVLTDTARPEANAAPQAQNLNSMARTYRQEIFSQVEQGILNGAQNGSNRITLQLNPVELGQITVVLSVHQGEVKATIRADQQESADALRGQMAELKASLEAEGLKVKELDVQTNLREDPSSAQWDGHQDHNLMRDAEERNRMMRLARIRRDTAGQAAQGETLESAGSATHQNGLHVVA